MADMTTQRYETHIVPGPDGLLLEKPHVPGTYEFYNEVLWLGEMAAQGFERFTVPEVRKADPLTGVVQMELIPGIAATEETRADVLAAAQELHSTITSPNALVRVGAVEKEDFPGYLASTVDAREAQLAAHGIERPGLLQAARESILGLMCDGGFGYDHKDLRYRHALRRTDGLPLALIDWEFGNIAHPGQDLAKLSYDRRDQATRRDGSNYSEDLPLPDIIEDTVLLYSKAGGHPTYDDDALFNAIWRLYPLAPIERARSLLDRKPKRYREEIERDLALVEEWHDTRVA